VLLTLHFDRFLDIPSLREAEAALVGQFPVANATQFMTAAINHGTAKRAILGSLLFGAHAEEPFPAKKAERLLFLGGFSGGKSKFGRKTGFSGMIDHSFIHMVKDENRE
jgi:hypothetical protein